MHRAAQRLERQRVLVVVAEPHVERRRAGELDELRVDLDERLVLGVVEQRRAQRDRARQARSWPRPRGCAAARRRCSSSSVSYGSPSIPSREISSTAASTVATCSSSSADSSRNGTRSWPCSARSARRPALVLLEQPAEPLPARLGQLELRAVAVEDVDLLPLVGRAGSPRARTPSRCSARCAPCLSL